MTLVELLIVMAILTLTLGEVTRSFVTISHLEPMQRETAAALDRARGILEELRTREFSDLVALYDDDAANDPDGPGTAPGSGFAITGLAPQAGDPDGWTGQVDFDLNGGQLREDGTDVELGYPRDLNLDGSIDAANHIGDYQVLPVRIRFEWTGASGDRQLEFVSTLAPPS